MARPLRMEFAGATYHVMARGNQGQKICLDDHDREMWLATLVQAWKRTGWRIHAWALFFGKWMDGGVINTLRRNSQMSNPPGSLVLLSPFRPRFADSNQKRLEITGFLGLTRTGIATQY